MYVKIKPKRFPTSLNSLELIEYDGFDESTKFTVNWADILEYANAKISTNQLILRGKYFVN